MNTPIVLYENGDTSIFLTVEELISYVEIIDVAEGLYVAYDTDANKYKLTTDGKQVFFTFIAKGCSDELRQILIRHLHYVKDKDLNIIDKDKWFDTATLKDLLDKSEEIAKKYSRYKR